MTPILQTSQMAFAYGDRQVLRDVSLTLFPGELVALLGPNGSGKSTLIQSLFGALRARGSIHWQGRALADWSPRLLARVVAYLPQSPAYDADQTAGDVVRLGRAPYLGALGIESSADIQVIAQVSTSLQLDELLDRPLDELSGGQRQRVFLARALAQEPKALLLDEPSSFLDLRHQLRLCQLLRALTREHGLTVLMASHDLNMAAWFADRVMLLHEGHVIAQGPPAEVLDPARIGEIYQVRMTRVELPDGRLMLVPDVNAAGEARHAR